MPCRLRNTWCVGWLPVAIKKLFAVIFGPLNLNKTQRRIFAFSQPHRFIGTCSIESQRR